MRKLNVAVIFDQALFSGGGVYQSHNAMTLASKLESDSISVTFFSFQKVSIRHISVNLMSFTCLEKVLLFVRRRIKNRILKTIFRKLSRYSAFEKKLMRNGIDLVYFVSPSRWANDLEELNYMVTIWDTAHRDEPEFPEVRNDAAIEARDLHYLSITRRAVCVFVDSKHSKNRVNSLYGVGLERICVLPFQQGFTFDQTCNSGEGIYIKEKLGLSHDFIFYPAQFWAHKNHSYLLVVLQILRKRYNIDLYAVFAGIDKGNLAYIKQLSCALGVQDLVVFPGYVPDEEIYFYYQQAIAVTMPTYFGPTNLPPLEAFCTGTPVFYPDSASFGDFLGIHESLIDWQDPNSLAEKLVRLSSDEEFRTHLIESGYKRYEEIQAVDRLSILQSEIERFRWKRFCWGEATYAQ
jgi:glycosyltransferase involved in cell wall biosynthesis